MSILGGELTSLKLAQDILLGLGCLQIGQNDGVIQRFFGHSLARLRAAVVSVREFGGDGAGVSAVLFALISPILIGSMGLAAEVSYWRLHQRMMQNAADAAAIAAATNGGSTYAAEALAIAAQYGFQNGVGNVSIQ